jgi:ketosteroid isomerase-like protein
MRSIQIAAAIAVLGLATVEASAQQVDQNTRQQIEQLSATYHENGNNHDAAGVAGLFTKDGVLVSQASMHQ